MFGSSKDQNFDGFVIKAFAPGITVCELVSVKLEQPKKNDGTVLAKRIVFEFENADGQRHVHNEIDPGDDANKAKNLVIRVGHILSKFVPKQDQQNTTFVDYAKWAVATLGTAYKGKKVKLIVVGNVYGGKASCRVPGFPPFIAKEGDELQLSATHLKDNKAYFEFMNDEVSSGGDNDALSDFQASDDSGNSAFESNTFGSAPVEDPSAQANIDAFNSGGGGVNPAQNNANSDFQ